jgi:hypothetical protein
MQRLRMTKPYRAYLLRLWQAGDPAAPKWLASLEDPHTRQVIRFASLERLFDFVRSLEAAGNQAEDCDIGEGRDKEVEV